MALFSREFRDELSEGDARWKSKLVIRMLMNCVCIISLGCATFTLIANSKFQPNGYEQARAVLVYLPCDGITIAWNMINILHFLIRRKVFSNVTNILIHFCLGAGFAIVGIYVTVVTWSAFKHLGEDLYGIDALGPHNLVALNGTVITVDPTNVASCPAFFSCADQNAWYQAAHARAIVSVLGSLLFDTAFLAHVVFFLWSCNDAIFGTRGRSARVEAREERDRIRKFQEEHPIPETSATNKSFDITAKPSREVLERNGLIDLPERDPNIDMGGRPHISRPVYTEHITYNISKSGKEFTPSKSRTFVLRPAADSRESLSLSIFEATPTTMRPVSGLPTLPHTIIEEEFYDATPPVPPLPTLSSESLLQNASSASRSRKSSNDLGLTAPSAISGMALDSKRMSSARSSLQGAVRPSSHNQIPLEMPTNTNVRASSLHSRYSGSQADCTQQPYSQYSYYRTGLTSKRPSSTGTVGPSLMHPMPKAYGSSPFDQASQPDQRQESTIISEDEYNSRESVYSNRESISALPPISSKRESSKSAKSSKSTRPNKVRRKSTLRNVVNSENTPPL